jgi:hypothetical protein
LRFYRANHGIYMPAAYVVTFAWLCNYDQFDVLHDPIESLKGNSVSHT